LSNLSNDKDLNLREGPKCCLRTNGFKAVRDNVDHSKNGWKRKGFGYLQKIVNLFI